ncbi:DUF1450 domain-containing protein [Bacillus suaedaesalsae]|uniref:DUF1450 domain-containing protein n=1 Tax=Bacillus suaedaesalsae TaxID=2810349 RepID=A0ABS2DH77_9BACI|nr:DUF1450 domain-containing protein [Bacillus suaedaesalsae]
MKLLNKLLSKQKKTTIEFCQKNLEQFVGEEHFPSYEEFLNSKDIHYKEYECQSRCKECKLSPYAIVDDEMIIAEDCMSLLEAMKYSKNKK